MTPTKKLYLVEKIHRLVVFAANEKAAKDLVRDLHCDDLFRAQRDIRVLHEVTKPEQVSTDLLDQMPHSTGVCLRCDEDHEGSTTAKEILADPESVACFADPGWLSDTGVSP